MYGLTVGCSSYVCSEAIQDKLLKKPLQLHVWLKGSSRRVSEASALHVNQNQNVHILYKLSPVLLVPQ